MPAQILSMNPPAPPAFEGSEGYNNANPKEAQDRILKGHSYKNMGTICIIPTREGGSFKTKFIENRDGLIKPPNHPFATFFVEGFEVGDAFNSAIWGILSNPELMKWNSGRGPWIFTLEDDNLPPADALVKLLEDIHNTPYAAISGLYWTKGEGGVPQIWGHPATVPPDCAPQVPIPDTIQECRGIGMGCAVWDIQMFLDPRVRQGMGANGVPIWFKTWAEVENGVPRVGTQDLSFCLLAQKFGYRFAVDTRVRVGHCDYGSGQVW